MTKKKIVPIIATIAIRYIAFPGTLRGLGLELTSRKVWPLFLWNVVYSTELSFQVWSSQGGCTGEIRWNTWTYVRNIPEECGETSGLLLLCTRRVMCHKTAIVASRCSFLHSAWLDIQTFRKNPTFLSRRWLGGGGGKLGFNFYMNF